MPLISPLMPVASTLTLDVYKDNNNNKVIIIIIKKRSERRKTCALAELRRLKYLAAALRVKPS